MAPKKITDSQLQIMAARPPLHHPSARTRPAQSTSWSSASSSTSHQALTWPDSPSLVISVYADRTFSFITKTPPRPFFCSRPPASQGREHEQGEAGQGHRKADHRLPRRRCRPERATVEAAAKSIRGTARSMGIEVVA